MRDGDPSGAQSDQDIMSGGGGRDTVSYATRTGALLLDIGYSRIGGDIGVPDEIRDVENLVGGPGDDRIASADFDSHLFGGAGDDFLRGRAGDDRLLGEAGADAFACGSGRDVVYGDRPADLLYRTCEVLVFAGESYRYRVNPRATVGRRSVRFRLSCPSWAYPSLRGSACGGTLRLREMAGRRRLIGSGTLVRGRGLRRVSVPLTGVGRRLVARRPGVRATATLAGSGLPSVGWSLQLRGGN